jgi:hypothetical protein
MAIKPRYTVTIEPATASDLFCWLDLHPHHQVTPVEVNILARDVDLCWAVVTDPCAV